MQLVSIHAPANNGVADYKNRLPEYLRATDRPTDKNFPCPWHDDHEPSMVALHASAGEYCHCFSCGVNASIYAFAALDAGVSDTRENYAIIAKQIEVTLGIENDWKPPEQTLEARLIRAAQRVSGFDEIRRAAVWPFRDAGGNIIFYDVRVEEAASGSKNVISISPDGKAKGVPVAWYNADKIADDPEAMIMIHEGAKCADAGTKLLPQFIHTTTNRFVASGAKSAPIDLLRGRRVWLFPDNDIPGRTAMLTLRARLEGVADCVNIIDLPPELENIKGADIADCETAPDIDKLITPEELQKRNADETRYTDEFPADEVFIKRWVLAENLEVIERDVAVAEYLLKNARGQIISTPTLGLMLWNKESGAFENRAAENKLTNYIIDFTNSALRRYQGGKMEMADQQIMKVIFDFLDKYMRSMTGLRNVVAAIKTKSYKPEEALNSDPHTLNCKGLAIDLRTGKGTNAAPDMYFTASAGVRPERGKPRVFLNFLESLELTAGEREYLLRFMGYCLTGETREHKFLDLCGTGRNGKGVIIRILQYCMGSYAVNIDSDLLCGNAMNKNLDPAKLALFGKRLAVHADLPNDGKYLRMDMIKSLTGGDMLDARALFQTERTYWNNTAKIIFATNHTLQLKETGPSIRGRLRYIQFKKSFEGCEDKTLDEKLRAEAPRILSLLIDYAVKYYAEGLPDNSDIMGNTDRVIKANDIIGQFLAEQPETEIGRGELYARYCSWCENTGGRALARNNFTQKLYEHGVTETGLLGEVVFKIR